MIGDPDALRNAVANYIRSKHWAHGYEILTPFEQTLRLALECARHEDGGTLLEEALRGKERCAELVAALEDIGARHAAAAMWRAHTLCAAVPVERAAGATSPDDWCELVGDEALDTLEAMFVENEVSDCVLSFFSANRHRLRARLNPLLASSRRGASRTARLEKNAVSRWSRRESAA